MKIAEIIVVDKARAGALDIQRHIIEEFDDDNLASSGELRIGCDLTMDLGFPAVMFTIDLPYYKDALYLHYGVGLGKAGPGYVARENNKQHAIMMGRQHDTVPELLAATIRILATEGPPDAHGNSSEKSFGYYFQKAYHFPDRDDDFSDDVAATLMTAVLKGKRVKIASTKLDRGPVDDKGVRFTLLTVNGGRALMIES